ncbi:MAG: nucleoside monophosphate kinase, partial [Planctomycetota bacterium]
MTDAHHHEKYQCVLLFGAPGAGKGTQGAILGRIPGFFHLSCGEVFRSLDIHSDLGKVFYEYSSKGELVPDEVTVDIDIITAMLERLAAEGPQLMRPSFEPSLEA